MRSSQSVWCRSHHASQRTLSLLGEDLKWHLATWFRAIHFIRAFFSGIFYVLIVLSGLYPTVQWWFDYAGSRLQTCCCWPLGSADNEISPCCVKSFGYTPWSLYLPPSSRSLTNVDIMQQHYQENVTFQEKCTDVIFISLNKLIVKVILHWFKLMTSIKHLRNHSNPNKFYSYCLKSLIN